ncbi:MAG: hypothetical protein JWM27_213 [Gemmatimonadetes bacterium]|nr:hypothetical protein [Gemmatimonadota bacterium]
MSIHDDFRDLAPLDPELDAQRWERMVAGITLAAAPELARRARAPDLGLLQVLAAQLRPTLSAAALLAAAAAAVLTLAQPQQQVTSPASAGAAPTQVASALGYSEPVAAWLVSGQAPSTDELLATAEGGAQ